MNSIKKKSGVFWEDIFILIWSSKTWTKSLPFIPLIYFEKMTTTVIWFPFFEDETESKIASEITQRLLNNTWFKKYFNLQIHMIKTILLPPVYTFSKYITTPLNQTSFKKGN